jgi:hypothetical protein
MGKKNKKKTKYVPFEIDSKDVDTTCWSSVWKEKEKKENEAPKRTGFEAMLLPIQRPTNYYTYIHGIEFQYQPDRCEIHNMKPILVNDCVPKIGPIWAI